MTRLVYTSFLVTYVALGTMLACGVTPAQHAANVGEATQATAEYTQCRESAKLDGGWDAYQACACGVDKRHGVNTASGCP